MRWMPAVIALATAACTSFGSGTDEPSPSPAPSGSSTADGGGPPAPTPVADGGPPSEGGVAPKTLACGLNECPEGVTCCVQSNTATCGDDTCNGGWRFKCFSANDCPPSTVCCNRDKVVSCETTCEGGDAQQICEDGAECQKGLSCQKGACGSNESYGYCAATALKPLCF